MLKEAGWVMGIRDLFAINSATFCGSNYFKIKNENSEHKTQREFPPHPTAQPPPAPGTPSDAHSFPHRRARARTAGPEGVGGWDCVCAVLNPRRFSWKSRVRSLGPGPLPLTLSAPRPAALAPPRCRLFRQLGRFLLFSSATAPGPVPQSTSPVPSPPRAGCLQPFPRVQISAGRPLRLSVRRQPSLPRGSGECPVAAALSPPQALPFTCGTLLPARALLPARRPRPGCPAVPSTVPRPAPAPPLAFFWVCSRGGEPGSPFRVASFVCSLPSVLSGVSLDTSLHLRFSFPRA